MVKRKEDMTQTVKVNMRGGDGQAVVTDILDKGEYKGSARLLGTIRLEPGCSIGEHVHEGDSEIFVVERGCPTYDDGGVLVEAKPGDVLVCPAETSHSIRNNTDETVDIIALIVYA